jgi:hypothetical protein
VLEFASGALTEDADWVRVEQIVDSIGGANFRMPHPELPGIATFEVPDDTELEPVLERLREIGSVSNVQAEAWRQSAIEPDAFNPEGTEEDRC